MINSDDHDESNQYASINLLQSMKYRGITGLFIERFNSIMSSIDPSSLIEHVRSVERDSKMPCCSYPYMCVGPLDTFVDCPFGERNVD